MAGHRDCIGEAFRLLLRELERQMIDERHKSVRKLSIRFTFGSKALNQALECFYLVSKALDLLSEGVCSNPQCVGRNSWIFPMKL